MEYAQQRLEKCPFQEGDLLPENWTSFLGGQISLFCDPGYDSSKWSTLERKI